MSGQTSCEYCSNYIYDEDYECYECQVCMDEDDLARLMQGSHEGCPYFQFDDEYRIVRKQM